ncbi:MAG: HlyD family efflux transporter periplasmic adaptor subunit [Bacteroidota bacterium]|nr:HlyD family efflux transporter periplasmic adaptor subunit [Bacteroidota bacterium]
MENNNNKDETNSISIPFRDVGGASPIELSSDEVQEILSRPPHSLVRYGISIICGVLFVLFIGSFFFRYPDIVQGDIVITTENPPVWLIAKSTGKIKELLCSDKQMVNQGDFLAVIDNSASTSDVQTMKRLLFTVLISDSSFYIQKELIVQSYELGEIQSNFSTFTKAAMNYDNFLTLNLINQEKTSLQKQILDRSIYSSNLQKQLELKKKEFKISKSPYERDKLLFERKVISESSMETTELSYLNKQQELQQLQTSISLEDVESLQMKESVNKLSLQYLQEKNQLFSELKSAHRELIAAIEKWQQTYLLIALQTGIVTFNTFWKKNQFINSGDKIFAIISHNPGQLIGKIKVPLSGSGKVQIGQLVNIKVAKYPYLEFGVLQGKTRNISLVANNEFYTVEVDFSEGLRTTINKELEFTGELNGTAEIITDNRSLFERIITPINYLAKKFFK